MRWRRRSAFKKLAPRTDATLWTGIEAGLVVDVEHGRSSDGSDTELPQLVKDTTVSQPVSHASRRMRSRTDSSVLGRLCFRVPRFGRFPSASLQRANLRGETIVITLAMADPSLRPYLNKRDRSRGCRCPQPAGPRGAPAGRRLECKRPEVSVGINQIGNLNTLEAEVQFDVATFPSRGCPRL